MKPRKVKTKILKLVQIFGSRGKLAKKLNISERYIYLLQNGEVPGWRLYKDICELYESENNNNDHI